MTKYLAISWFSYGRPFVLASGEIRTYSGRKTRLQAIVKVGNSPNENESRAEILSKIYRKFNNPPEKSIVQTNISSHGTDLRSIKSQIVLHYRLLLRTEAEVHSKIDVKQNIMTMPWEGTRKFIADILWNFLSSGKIDFLAFGLLILIGQAIQGHLLE